jgi:hypothetical protein
VSVDSREGRTLRLRGVSDLKVLGFSGKKAVPSGRFDLEGIFCFQMEEPVIFVDYEVINIRL